MKTIYGSTSTVEEVGAAVLAGSFDLGAAVDWLKCEGPDLASNSAALQACMAWLPVADLSAVLSAQRSRNDKASGKYKASESGRVSVTGLEWSGIGCFFTPGELLGLIEAVPGVVEWVERHRADVVPSDAVAQERNPQWGAELKREMARQGLGDTDKPNKETYAALKSRGVKMYTDRPHKRRGQLAIEPLSPEALAKLSRVAKSIRAALQG